MTVLNLGPLGRIEFTRRKRREKRHALPISTTSRPGDESNLPSYSDTIGIEGLDTATTAPNMPTGLSAISSMWCSLRAQKPICKEIQFRRYIIEIIAITFAADFHKLNAALHGTDSFDIPETNTTLCQEEREDLVALSILVRKVHGQLHRKEINAISQADEHEIVDAIVRPGERIDFGLGQYTLDLVGWYSTHGHPAVWSQTIPGYWATNPLKISQALRDLEFLHSMRTFRNLVYRISSMNNHVEEVLLDAFESCQRRCGLDVVERWPVYYPKRRGYDHMGKILSCEKEFGRLRRRFKAIPSPEDPPIQRSTALGNSAPGVQ